MPIGDNGLAMDSEHLSSIVSSVDSYQFNATSHAPCSNLSNSNSSSSSGKVAGSDVIVLLWQILGPILLLVGFTGNILVLITMTRRRMRGTSTYVYLVGMAAIDLIVLTVGLLPAWLEGSEILTIKNLHPAACKLQKFLDYTSGDAAVWLRMAFTIDRLVAVMVPLYTGRCCGRTSSARIYVLASCVVAVAKDLHVFWTRGAEYSALQICTDNGTMIDNQIELVSNCGYPAPEYKHFELYVRPWIAFALVSVGPFAIIAICNTLIIVALVRRRRAMFNTSRQSLSTNRSLSGTTQEQQFFQMAAMCVAASGLFLVCTAPTIVMLIGKPYWNVPSGGNTAYEISKAITGILFYVTFSANFFLYCLTGKRFRTTLFGLCRRSYDSMRLSTSSGARRSTQAGKFKMDAMRQNPANASAARHRSNYRVAAAVRQSSNGAQSAALEMAQFGPNSRSNASNGTASAREMTATNAMPLEPSHVTVGPSVCHVSTVTCSVATGNSATGIVVDSDVARTSCVTEPGTEQITTYDDGHSLTNILNRSDNSSHVDDGYDDVDQCCQREPSQQSNYQSEPINRQTFLVEETDNFDDPLADDSYNEQTHSECDGDKSSLTSGHCRQRLTSDSLINDNSNDVFEHSSSFSSGSRILGAMAVENDVKWVVGPHKLLPWRPRSSSFPGLSCDFDLPKHLAKCKTLRYRMYSLLM